MQHLDLARGERLHRGLHVAVVGAATNAASAASAVSGWRTTRPAAAPSTAAIISAAAASRGKIARTRERSATAAQSADGFSVSTTMAGT